MPDGRRLERHERSRLAGQRVVEADGHGCALDASRRPSARDRRARRPRSPSRLPRRRLDVDGRSAASPRRPAIAARIASSRAPRRGRAATIVRSTLAGAPARAPPSRSTTSASSSRAGDAARASRASGREEPTEVAEAGGAEQRIGDRMQGDVAVGMAVEARGAGDGDAAQRAAARPARTGGCRADARSASAGRRRGARLAPDRGRRARVTLRLVGSPGTTWTGILQASSSAASSVHVAWPPGGYAANAVSQQAAPDTLRGLGRRRASSGRRSRRRRSPSTRLTVSAIGTTGIAAPCAWPSRRRPRRSASALTSGRAPSWTRTTRSSSAGRLPVEGREPGRDRVLASLATGDDGRDGGRQPRRGARPRRGGPRRSRRRRSGRRRGSRPARRASRPSSGRSPIGREQLVRAAHPRRAAGRHDDGVGRPDRPADGPVAGASLNRGAAGRRSSDRPPSAGRGSPRRRRPDRCGGRRPRRRSSCRRRGSRRPDRPPCLPG